MLSVREGVTHKTNCGVQSHPSSKYPLGKRDNQDSEGAAPQVYTEEWGCTADRSGPRHMPPQCPFQEGLVSRGQCGHHTTASGQLLLALPLPPQAASAGVNESRLAF